MGRQWNKIIEDIEAISSGTSVINVNLGDIEALLTTLQADVANGVLTAPSTSGGTGPSTFTSTSYGTLAVADSTRFGLEIYNEGPGNLHVTLGTSTTTTTFYTVRLSSGDLFEMPVTYTGLVGGIFATAGTARVTSLT